MEEKSIMRIVRRMKQDELNMMSTSSFNQTQHFISKRLDRYQAYLDLGLLNDIRFVDGFLVDKGHIDGMEFHCITPEAIIFIFNNHTLRLITIKGARGGQISRYYKETGESAPLFMKAIIAMAYNREKINPIHNL